jgi:hypothetical protein
MPRPRKHDSGALITSIVDQFAERVGIVLERFITGRIEKELKKDKARSGRGGRGRGGRGGRRKRARVTCYYPGCKNIAAPRFGMFCAAEHKGLPKAEKEKYRAQHLKTQAAPARLQAAKRGKRGRRG